MVNSLKRNMTSDNVTVRIVTTYICFLIIFFAVTVLSYYLLPQGILLNKHPVSKWYISSDWVISALQIFSYNLLSVMVIIFGNMFSARRNKTKCFMPLGYLAFFVMIIINAIVLGTWSFSVVSQAISLIDRIIRTFDVVHRAGLWEMSGQLFILCATAKISLIITDGKETSKKNWKTIKFSRQELMVFGIGLMFMLVGAIIESNAIIKVT